MHRSDQYHFYVLYVSVLLISLYAARGTRAQDLNVMFIGDAATNYEASIEDSFEHNFSAVVTPHLLALMKDELLFEAELEFGFHDGTTQTALEHVQIHYLGFERVQFTAGRFFLPFGLWKHQNWINKMPSPPLLYEDAHGGVAEEAPLPIPYDMGVMVSGKQPLGQAGAIVARLWLTQGPRLVTGSEEGHEDDHGEEEGAASLIDPRGPGDAVALQEALVPRIGYGVTVEDNNTNKMVGARLGFMTRRRFRAYVSGFHAAYDADNQRSIDGGNLSVEWQDRGWELRGEGLLLRQEFVHDEIEEAVTEGGYYLQLAHRAGSFEPLVRWSHLPPSSFEGHPVQEERRQLAVGVNYWMEPSIPVKVVYQWEIDGPDHVLLQWAFGF